MLSAKRTFVSRWAKAMAVAIGLVICSASPNASAENARLNADARLRARPGERAPTLTKLNEGQSVRVVGRQGRWVKVSVGGRTGWITRTQIGDAGGDTQVAARDVPARKRDRGGDTARKGWSSLDEDATGDEVVAEDETMDVDDEDEAPVAPKKAKKPAAKPKKVARAKAKRSKAKRAAGFEAGMRVVVRSEATVRERPSGKADEIYTAEKGEEMKVILVAEDGGKWVRVQDGEGTKGWIESRSLASADAGDDEAEDEAEDEDDEESAIASDESDDEEAGEAEDEEPTRVRRRAKKGKLWYSLGANLAFVSKKQTFDSDSTSVIGQYELANNTPAVVIGALAGKRFGKYEVLGEGWYMRTVGGSGISVPDGMMAEETLAWTEQAIDVRASFGYHLDKTDSYTIYGRAGLHINNTVVDESMVAKLPSETLQGYIVGASLEAPKVTPKVGVRVSLDYLISGKLTQTENLTDGDEAVVGGYYLHALATYKYKPNLDALATYNLAYEGVAFSGASTREAAATNGKRRDMQHVIGVGVRYQF